MTQRPTEKNPALIFNLRLMGRVVVAEIVGDAGVDHVEELEQNLKKLMAQKPAVLVLDLSKLTYISSIGFGVLIRFRNHLIEQGGKLKLAALNAKIVEAFNTARLSQVFEI